MLFLMITMIFGFVAMIPIIYISYMFNWKSSTETFVGLIVFGSTMFLTSPYVENFFK